MPQPHDLSKYSLTELLTFIRDILARPGCLTDQDAADLLAIQDEIHRRGCGDPTEEK